MNTSFSYLELKKRILADLGVESLRALKPSAGMRWKLVLLPAAFFATYVSLVTQSEVDVVSVLLHGAALVFLGAGTMLNVFHDLVHGSLIRNAKVRSAISYFSDLMGASHLIWNNRHNRCHHYHTNDAKRDEDLQTSEVFRFSDLHPRRAHHRFQALYAPLGYLTYAFFWFYPADIEKFLRKRVMELDLKGMTLIHSVFFVVFKVLHVLLFVVVPYLKWGVDGIVGYLLVISFIGMIVSSVNNIAHVFSGARYHETRSFPNRDAFIRMQFETSACYLPESEFVNMMMGGVNHQLVHHLFPEVPHAHFPRIYRVVKRYADECGVQVHAFQSLSSALKSHYKELARLGNATTA